MGATEAPDQAFSDPLRKPETIELVRAYFSIEDETVRQRFRDLAKALASKQDATAEQPPGHTHNRGLAAD